MERAEIMTWRKAERERLIKARMDLEPAWRMEASRAIVRNLVAAIGDMKGKSVSVYWPMRGEPDLRPFMEELEKAGGHGLLPVVPAPKTPMIFKPWKTGEPLEKGIWNIPVPATSETAVPDICLAPVIGYDKQNYRLGYGGGFFDRTLASFAKKPTVIGVGYRMQAIETIHPLPHDIAMDVIVTEGK